MYMLIAYLSQMQYIIARESQQLDTCIRVSLSPADNHEASLIRRHWKRLAAGPAGEEDVGGAPRKIAYRPKSQGELHFHLAAAGFG